MKNIPFPCLITLLLILTMCGPALADPVRIGIGTFQINAREDLNYVQSGLNALLPSRISLPGRIAVVDSNAMHQALGSAQPLDSLNKKTRLATDLELDFILTGSLTKIGETISIDAVLFNAAEPERSTPLSVACEGLDGLVSSVNALATDVRQAVLYGTVPQPLHIPEQPTTTTAEPDPAEASRQVEAQPARPQAQPTAAQPAAFKPSAPVFAAEPWREYTVTHAPFICMTAGDLTGQGRVSLLLADHFGIRIYDPTPETLTLTHNLPTMSGETIIHIEAFDLNDDGRAEIYVSSYDGNKANSFAAVYTGDHFERIAENMPWLLRVYPSRRGLTLTGVQPGATSPLFGSVFEFTWRDGSPEPAGEFILPGGVSPFGSSRADISGDGRDDYVAFSRGMFSLDYRLHVLSGTGRIMWRDSDRFGGEPNAFTRYTVGQSAESAEPIPLRVHCADINADHRTEILLPSNSKQTSGLLSRLASYNRGEILCLHWDGNGLTRNWSSGVLDGYISDFLVADIDGDGTQELIVLSVTGPGLSGKARNTIRIYKQGRSR